MGLLETMVKDKRRYFEKFPEFPRWFRIPENNVAEAIKFSADISRIQNGLRSQTRENKHGEQDWIREKPEILRDTFQGKLAEYAFKEYLSTYGLISSDVDDGVYERSVWDQSYDLKVMGKNISIKSTKTIGSFLLLETNSYCVNRAKQTVSYIHDMSEKAVINDFIVLAKVGFRKKSNDHGYREDIPYNQIILDSYTDNFYDCCLCGYISNKDFFNAATNKDHILSKGAAGFGAKGLATENYCIPIRIKSGQLHASHDLVSLRPIENIIEALRVG